MEYRMGKQARVRQLKELISKEKFDIVGIQETIKKSFSDNELKGFTNGVPYIWNWIPAYGHSGGILVGVKYDRLEIEGWNKGVYYLEVMIKDRLDNFRWRLVVVYGPANHDWSADFLKELDMGVIKILTCLWL